ncbi:helicase-exonuclease AddAB subunit AddB [Lysinibacillus boronitolerans]|uniref:helicase-exonuclease AddAB subunit AddB n=1 Tax=Lysinibacillus boronitolerans TaxID=309788 RepID=UPI002161CDF8|nr:helicase-exonuclease AddAB subunit AddB [Lysinibacillus boronitolerans]MCS1393847.1 helicase-exonuclease AddAB subunit AddB [Lysinibacillus boronitolerans]
MALRIVSGRSGTGKSAFIHQEIVEQLKTDPLGHPIFIIVPDQMSYSTEYELTNKHSLQGLIRAQVMTFKRLAWLVLQETGGIARKEVNGYGYRMLIRKLLEEQKSEFSLFRQAAGKRGFTEEIETLLKEFSRYSVNSSVLAEVTESLKAIEAPNTLQAKANDLHVVLQALEERLGTSYVDSEGYYPILTEQLKYAETMKQATIYIDGFTAFTVRELELVRELLKVTKQVTVVLPFDHIDEAFDEQALFHEAALTNQRLHDMAKEEGIDVELPLHFYKTQRFHSEDLQHVEANFADLEPQTKKTSGDVKVLEASNRRAEVHAIAREITKLTREDGFRYQDIVLLYRQADLYDPLITSIFQQYEIPIFTNTKKTMLHHPLIELSRSALEVMTSNWKYEPVFRSVKTDLFFPLQAELTIWRERADRLENYCLAQGIYGERWFEEARWFYKKYRGLEFHSRVQTDEERAMQAEIEAIRDEICQPLKLLQDKLDNAKNGRDIATALFELVESLQVYDKLQAMKDRELERGDALAASEHEQAWNEWVAVLDQFVYMFGEQEMTVEEAAKILDEGFDTLEFSRIPPTLDEVMVATVDLARLSNIKVAFVIGMNDGVYPTRMEYEGLLSDIEREWFSQIGYELAPTSTNRLLQENFLFYRAITTPSNKLYMTYPTADEEGKALLASLYIKKIIGNDKKAGLLSDISIERVVVDPIELLDGDVLPYLRHPRTALAHLMVQLRQAEHSRELAPEWLALQRFYKQDPYWALIFERVLYPITHKNEAEPLETYITQELYGQKLTSSVSRIEKYFRCPFSHFTTYGLRLEERAEYRLETFAMGDLFHEALKWITEETHRQQLSWIRLTTKQIKQLARQAVEQIVPVFSHQILLSSARYRYIQRKLIRIVERTMTALTQHAHVSHFKPIAIEASFGPGQHEQLPPLEIDLTGGKKMFMRGRIDRVDSATIDDRSYLRIVDYKSSARDLDLNEVYYGLSLQVLTYLDVAMENSSYWLSGEAEPAGVLYVHVHNPMLKLDKDLTDSEIEEDRLKQYKMKGLLSENAEAILSMDEHLEESSGHSKIIPVYMKKDGTPSESQSRIVPVNDMKKLQHFVRRKHQEAGNGILSGDTAISPYKLKAKTACDYCQFAAVCQFDPSDGKQGYRQLMQAKPNDIVDKIRKEIE